MPSILLVGKFPKPSENPFDTYYTAHGGFAKDFQKKFKKSFLTFYYGGQVGNAKQRNKNQD
ncbi:hypothetical protein KQI15_12170 [Intestinimonas butyriciproducens]|uniref:hypothetical protein n=1 Tax=Intestinimonas butyriciproducens TaxID=1297617 RepID=UPI001C11CA95|nr:hypothetical protein [Intestinimonas butyriciproducens]MBU5230770.1 hypothetical protein [Intestinimonas butyriciproducens]